MVVYIVYDSDCNEGDCGCVLESVDSVWLDKEKAEERAKDLWWARVDRVETED